MRRELEAHTLPAFLVALAFVLFHYCPRRDLFGSFAVTTGLLRGPFDVLVLSLLLGAYTAEMSFLCHKPALRCENESCAFRVNMPRQKGTTRWKSFQPTMPSPPRRKKERGRRARRRPQSENAPAAASIQACLGTPNPLNRCLVRTENSRKFCISSLSDCRQTSLSAINIFFFFSKSFTRVIEARPGPFSVPPGFARRELALADFLY